MEVRHLDKSLTRLHDGQSLVSPNIRYPPAYHYIIPVKRTIDQKSSETLVIGDNYHG